MRAAYWAGGIEPHDRGEPSVIKTSGFSDLVTSVQKAACMQAMHEWDVFIRAPITESQNSKGWKGPLWVI